MALTPLPPRLPQLVWGPCPSKWWRRRLPDAECGWGGAPAIASPRAPLFACASVTQACTPPIQQALQSTLLPIAPPAFLGHFSNNQYYRTCAKLPAPHTNHVAVLELHGLGTRGTQLARDDDLAALGARLHHEAQDAISGTVIQGMQEHAISVMQCWLTSACVPVMHARVVHVGRTHAAAEPAPTQPCAALFNTLLCLYVGIPAVALRCGRTAVLSLYPMYICSSVAACLKLPILDQNYQIPNAYRRTARPPSSL